MAVCRVPAWSQAHRAHADRVCRRRSHAWVLAAPSLSSRTLFTAQCPACEIRAASGTGAAARIPSRLPGWATCSAARAPVRPLRDPQRTADASGAPVSKLLRWPVIEEWGEGAQLDLGPIT